MIESSVTARVRQLAAFASLLAGFVPTGAPAQSILLAPMTLESNAEVSSVRGACEIVEQTMRCQMIQVLISNPTPQDEVEQSIQRQLAAPDVANFIAQACQPEARQAIDEMIQGLERVQASRAADRTVRTLNAIVRMCASPSPATLEAVLRERAAAEDATCQILTHSWQESFTRQAPDLWVSNVGPQGACGTITISELRSTNFSSLWTYRTRRVISNRDGSPFCAVFEEYNLMYSWRARPPLRSCDGVRFR